MTDRDDSHLTGVAALHVSQRGGLPPSGHGPRPNPSTTDLDQGDWMQTFTGRAFYPLNPRPADIDPIDIGHHLAQLCRYNGAVRRFYSVAEHSVLMSVWVQAATGGNREDALWALLHDATEAYVGDMIRPLKRQMPDYAAAEDKVMAAVAYRFGLDPAMPAIVKVADNRILQNERHALLGPPPRPWTSVEQLEPLDQTVIEGWDPQTAKTRFLDRWADLAGQWPL